MFSVFAIISLLSIVFSILSILSFSIVNSVFDISNIIIDMTREQFKFDNAVQTIIINSLDEPSKDYLKGCRTSFQMIERLKNCFYQSDQDLFNSLK